MKISSIFFNISNRLLFVILGKLIGFFSIPIITRALGPENFGIYSYILAIGSYSLLPSNWGFVAKGIRDIAKNTNSSEEIVNKITSARIILWGIGAIITILLCLFFFDKHTMLLIVIVTISNISLAASLDYFFYGKKNTFLPSISHFVGQLFFLFMVYLFIKEESDLSLLLFLFIISYSIECIILFFFYSKEYKFTFLFSFSNSFNLLKDNFLLGLGAKSAFFQNTFPILLIPIFLSNYDLGVFSASFKFFMIITVILQTFNLVFSPWIVEYRKLSKKNQKKLFQKLLILYSLIGIISMVVLYFLGSEVILLILGNEFIESQNLIKLFAITLLPIWPIYSIFASYMNNYESDKNYMWGSLITSISIAITIPLGIITMGLEGVIYGLFLSTLIVCVYYYLKIQNYFN